jgi:hypothetical protein
VCVVFENTVDQGEPVAADAPLPVQQLIVAMRVAAVSL